MPHDQRALARAARARAAATGENYTAARAALIADRDQPTSTSTVTIDPALLVPYPDEGNVTPAELGWRVLPADATPEQRAQAEAHWRPVTAPRPCRCSGSCLHGTACGTEDDGEDRCPGLLTHVDRYPGGLFSVDIWEDVYGCATCGEGMITSVELPAVPWGEASPGSGTVVYEKVRHPNFPDNEDGADGGYDPGCFECGAKAGYRCTCDDDDDDDDEYACDECGGGRGYGCNC